MLLRIVDNASTTVGAYFDTANIIFRVVIPISGIISIPICWHNIGINSIGIPSYFDAFVMPFDTLMTKMFI